MVHALKECWRVLEPGGQLLDVRPTGDDRELLVLSAGQEHLAGLIDVADGRPDDEAADAAILAVVKQGLFKRERGRQFDILNYWPTLAEMRGYIDERWGFAKVPARTMEAAEALVAGNTAKQLDIAVRGPLTMVAYRKTESPGKSPEPSSEVS